MGSAGSPSSGLSFNTFIFPNGGNWHQKGVDPFLDELEKEFETLEEYLKSRKSEEIEKNY